MNNAGTKRKMLRRNGAHDPDTPNWKRTAAQIMDCNPQPKRNIPNAEVE